MAVTPDTLRLLAGLRIRVGDSVDQAGRDLVRGWATAWDELAAEWDAALTELAAASTANGWPSRAQLARADRVWRAMDATRDALDGLAQDLDVRILQDLPDLTGDAALWQARITGSQLPPAAGSTAELVARFNRVDPAQLEQIVTRTTTQIHAATRPLSVEAIAVMRSQLIRGVAVGDNPRQVAALMLRRLEGGFNGGLTRALVISRTEMLDAYRAAAQAQDIANETTLTGWRWMATLDTRTCPSCLAQHGSLHPTSEAGPHDHQQGRCARLPVTKTWRELGFDIDEPPDIIPDARAWFDNLAATDQARIMGPRRLQLLQDGDISWDDLTRLRHTTGWRDSYTVTPVAALTA
ncbi:phage minor head protein [Ruania rhizosphaerae]|uniref:phage minor head protein n=1 Tax=Ruania rhizosphaerae TaxID=1840413 RepID=UPI00135991C6|nr:phage minor head protein [Ruania rhizosphaerae]